MIDFTKQSNIAIAFIALTINTTNCVSLSVKVPFETFAQAGSMPSNRCPLIFRGLFLPILCISFIDCNISSKHNCLSTEIIASGKICKSIKLFCICDYKFLSCWIVPTKVYQSVYTRNAY